MQTKTTHYADAAGRVLIAGFEGLDLPPHLMDLIRLGTLGGVVFFKRNIAGPEQVAEVISSAVAAAPKGSAPLFCIDQEGGRVARIREPLTVLPTARELADGNPPETARFAGNLVGLELRALGFTLDFAPVLDVDTRPNSPVIGDRSFSGDPERVAAYGLAFAEGLRQSGVIPCAKHFPGHGDAALDSHLSLPRVDHGMKRLLSVEMKPFERWIRENGGPIMTAHVIYDELDINSPATFSKKIITEELRSRMGFAGPVFTDDLEMGAVSEFGSVEQGAVNAIAAGVTGLLVCRQEELQLRIIERLTCEAEQHTQFATTLLRAARLMPAALENTRPDIRPNWINGTEHRDLKNELKKQLRNETV